MTLSSRSICQLCFFFFFNDTATTEIYTLSLHDALPICASHEVTHQACAPTTMFRIIIPDNPRSEEHTSELQSPCNLVCRLLLEKKKTTDSSIWMPRYVPTATCRPSLRCRRTLAASTVGS